MMNIMVIHHTVNQIRLCQFSIFKTIVTVLQTVQNSSANHVRETTKLYKQKTCKIKANYLACMDKTLFTSRLVHITQKTNDIEQKIRLPTIGPKAVMPK